MAREMVYEGPDLQQLLQRVIDERGPARIRPPERRRKGGLFGFFAREVYVITVDDSAPATTPHPMGAGVAAGTGAPVLAGASLDAGALRVDAATGAPTGAGTPSRPVGACAPSRSGIVTSPLQALVDATEDVAVLGTSSSAALRARPASPLRCLAGPSRASETAGDPRPAPGTKPFRDVLSEVASSLGEEPGSYLPEPDRLRPPRRPAAVRPLDLADVRRAERPNDTTARGDAAGAAGSGQRGAGHADERTPAQLSLIAVAEEAPVGLAVPERTLGLACEERSVEAPAPGEPAGSPDGPADLDATIVDLLRAAGFPEERLPRTALDPDRPLFEAVFASLPDAPPLPADPGGLVAVVGAAGMVRPTAQAIALAVDSPEDDVIVASPTANDRHARAECRARSAAQASALSPGWRRDKVAVVAVYGPPMGTTQGWTREMLHALRPSCVWGMASATTKPDDVRRWVGAIGGVDALVMTDVDATATPASILSLGIPIACLDDEPATPGRWAAVVAELLTRR